MALRLSSVSATPTSYPCCSAVSLAFTTLSRASSVRTLAFSASSSFLFKVAIWVLVVASWSSTPRSCSIWVSACFLALSRAVVAYFFLFLPLVIFSSSPRGSSWPPERPPQQHYACLPLLSSNGGKSWSSFLLGIRLEQPTKVKMWKKKKEKRNKLSIKNKNKRFKQNHTIAKYLLRLRKTSCFLMPRH